jgi:hypothetical protein
MGRSPGGNSPKVISGRYGMGIRAANAPACLGCNTAGPHGAIFTADPGFPEFAVGALVFCPVFPGFRGDFGRVFPQLGGIRLHLLNCGYIFVRFQGSNPFLVRLHSRTVLSNMKFFMNRP